jgi:hypothetical protein
MYGFCLAPSGARMRTLLLIGVVACGSGAREPSRSSGSSAPKVNAVLDRPLVQCERAVAAIDRVTACESSLHGAFDASRAMMADSSNLKNVFTDQFDLDHEVQKAGAQCAYFIVGTAEQPPATSCKLHEPADVADAKAYLEAFDAARTPVEPTGDAAADAMVRDLAKVRDTICACKTWECASAANEQWLAQTPAPIADAPAAAKLTARGLGYDISKCSSDMRFSIGH